MPGTEVTSRAGSPYGPRLRRVSEMRVMPSGWRSAVQHPSALLLTAQLLAIVAYPFLDRSRVGAAVLGVISMIAVGLALWVVRSTPALTLIGFAFGLPAIVMTMLEAIVPGEQWVTLTSAFLHAPFYFYVAYSLLRYLFHDDRVSTDELYAIAAAFTVVAWGFAYVFMAVTILSPGRSSL